MLDEGSGVPAERYGQALQTAWGCRAELERVFTDIDVLLAPSAPGEAPAHVTGTGDPVFNRIWTLLGSPCVNVPGLTGAGGMPVGIQLIGPRDGDGYNGYDGNDDSWSYAASRSSIHGECWYSSGWSLGLYS